MTVTLPLPSSTKFSLSNSGCMSASAASTAKNSPPPYKAPCFTSSDLGDPFGKSSLLSTFPFLSGNTKFIRFALSVPKRALIKILSTAISSSGTNITSAISLSSVLSLSALSDAFTSALTFVPKQHGDKTNNKIPKKTDKYFFIFNPTQKNNKMSTTAKSFSLIFLFQPMFFIALRSFLN